MTSEQKENVYHKWETILCNNCSICNGEKYVNNQQCKCKTKAIKFTALEDSNIPIKGFRTIKEHITNINYDFNYYFKNIQSEIYNVPNLFLHKFSNEINTEVIGYIAKNIINTKRIDNTTITVRYEIFENLIQMGLRSNVERDTRNQLNDIIKHPFVLIIDDLGTETGLGSTTKHNVKLLHLILKERLNRCLSTIICSQLNYSQIEKIYGDEIVKFLQNYNIVKGS